MRSSTTPDPGWQELAAARALQLRTEQAGLEKYFWTAVLLVAAGFAGFPLAKLIVKGRKKP